MAYLTTLWGITDVQDVLLLVIALIIVGEIVYILIDRFLE